MHLENVAYTYRENIAIPFIEHQYFVLQIYGRKNVLLIRFNKGRILLLFTL